MDLNASIVSTYLLFFGLANVPVHHSDIDSPPVNFREQRIVRTTGESIDRQGKPGASVTIVYPLAYRGDTPVQEVNRQIVGHLRSEFPENKAETLEAVIDSFFRDFWENVKQNPDSGWMHHWVVEIQGEVLLQTEDLACLKLTNDSYTGGAHPNQYVTLLNISLHDGHSFSLDELIVNRPQVNSLAEVAFRKKRSIPREESLRDAGFSFTGDKFHLPENVGFNKVGMVLHYNYYEVGSRVTGPTEIVIPYRKLRPLLSSRLDWAPTGGK